MRKEKGVWVKYLAVSIMILSILPIVSAYGRTRIYALDRGIEMISSVFNIRVLENNSYVQEGFLKLMIFLVIFSISNYGLKAAKIFDKEGGKKTSGIIAFAFSMIGVFMMPTDWLMATGGIITAIMSSFVFILVFIGGAYLAMFKLRPKEEGDKMGWLLNLLGLLLLLFLLFLIDIWAWATHMPTTATMPLMLLLKPEWLKKLGKK
jgi:hypothetical protein